MGKKAELIRERGQKQYGKEGESNMGIKANMMHIRKENADSQPFFHKPTTKRRSSWYNVREAMSRAVCGRGKFPSCLHEWKDESAADYRANARERDGAQRNRAPAA